MKEKVYNKLVRDNIPAILRAKGAGCVVCVMEDGPYREALRVKLAEESGEVAAAETKEQMAEELADVLEVVEALQAAYDISAATVAEIKAEKAARNGRFEKRLYLHSVTEDTGKGKADEHD